MASTNFTPRVTRIKSTWLQEVNDFVFGGGSYPSQAARPQYFGAAGDGVTDDTAAVLAASALGVEVDFPDGTYLIDNSALPAVVRWRGRGSNTVIKWKAGAASSNLLTLSGVVDATFTGIVFDGNRQNQTDSTGYYGCVGGTLSNGARVVFKDCEFINGRIADLYFTGPTGSGQSAEIVIENCRFYDGLVGDVTRASQAVGLSEGIRCEFNHNELIQPTGPASYGRAGLVLQRPAGSTSLAWGSVRAHGNYFENFGRGTSATLGCIYVYSGAELSAITGNIFRNSYGSAIAVKGDCGNTTVTSNSVYGNIDANSAALAFFDQADTYTSSLGRDIVVTGNTIRDAQQTSIFIDGARAGGLDDFKNAIISNNVCDGGVRGIHFRNINTLRIHGNVISATTGVAVFGEDCSGDVAIASNTLAGGLVGLDVSGTTSAARFNVSQNQVSSFTAAALRLRSSVESFQMAGNEITACAIAFDTRGASQASSITGNRVRGETTVWGKSGTYGDLTWHGNITSVALAFATRTLTIATGVATVFSDWHYVDTEGAAATDDLDTLNGGHEGRRVTLFAANNARDVVVKDGTGNLRLAGDFTLTHADDSIELIYVGTSWREISRSDNTV